MTSMTSAMRSLRHPPSRRALMHSGGGRLQFDRGPQHRLLLVAAGAVCGPGPARHQDQSEVVAACARRTGFFLRRSTWER
jgi:hypothetical protein